MKLYLIRHGETDWNKQRRLQGQSDIPLNEKGIRLAEVTSKGMASIPFDFVFTSPLIRSVETAELVLGRRKIPFFRDDRLKEIAFGAWEGKKWKGEDAEIPEERFQVFYSDPLHFQNSEDGESIPDVIARTHAFYEELIAREDLADKTILISTHGCALRALMQSIVPSGSPYWLGGVPLNCAVTEVDVIDGKAVLIEQDHIYYDKDEIVNFFTPK